MPCPGKARPKTISLIDPAKGLGQWVHLQHIRWTGWGRPTAPGSAHVYAPQAEGFVELDGRATITLSRRVRRLPDGCGNRGTGRIYTRLRVVFPPGYEHTDLRHRYTFQLPASGCETA